MTAHRILYAAQKGNSQHGIATEPVKRLKTGRGCLVRAEEGVEHAARQWPLRVPPSRPNGSRARRSCSQAAISSFGSHNRFLCGMLAYQLFQCLMRHAHSRYRATLAPTGIRLRTHQTGVRVAEVGFLLILIAGVWLIAAEIPAFKFARARNIVAGVLLAVGGLLLIIATHGGGFG
jgi:hypothetical protein